MRRRRVTVLDLVTKGTAKRLFARIMNANLASIMPQAVASWCESLGHEVRYFCYTGAEDLLSELQGDADIVFISSFTRAAQTAYAISNLYRSRGAVTVLGGPHARCYPEDAAKYFDYVLGFTDKAVLEDVLSDGAPHRPFGRRLSALRQPGELPGLRERWRFVEATLAKAPIAGMVPMIGSMGCPYRCNFCIDSVVDYQPLPFDQIREDLRFLRSRIRRPIVAWHDPNFGVRFDDYMTLIEDSVAPGQIRFVAESSLSLLSEPNVRRMKRNGFVGLLPGIESWFSLGNKSKTGTNIGSAKVLQVADQVNMILRHIPFVQGNFVLGLDCDVGAEPFELTKKFIDLVPGIYPALSLFTAYGRAAPLNLELQRAGRVLPFPFYFLDSIHAMNVRPQNYGWPELYDRTLDLIRYILSPSRVFRRFGANRGAATKFLNLIRAWSTKRIRYQSTVRGLLDTDVTVQRFFEGESDLLPSFYRNKMRATMGALWDALPDGALMHDPCAYLKSESNEIVAHARMSLRRPVVVPY
jgi:hypothetical protein